MNLTHIGRVHSHPTTERKPMRLKLFLIGLAALAEMSCQTEVGNTTGQPQAAGEPQDSGVMELQNGLSNRPVGESMH
jgi:hypothetical protein